MEKVWKTLRGIFLKIYVISFPISITLTQISLAISFLLNLDNFTKNLKKVLNKFYPILFFMSVILILNLFAFNKKLAYLKFIKSFYDFGIPFVLGLIVKNEIDKEKLFRYFIFAVVFVSILSFINLIFKLGIPFLKESHYNYRFLAGFLGKISFGSVLAVSMVMSLGLNCRLWVKILIFLVLFLVLMFNMTIGAFLGLFFSLSFIFAIKFRDRFIWCFLLFLLVASLFSFLIYPKFGNKLLRSLFLKKPYYTNAVVRAGMWQLGLRVVGENYRNLFFGIGFEVWPIYADFYLNKYRDKISYLRKIFAFPKTVKRGALKALKGHLHSNYIQMLVNSGILGLVSFLIMLFWIGRGIYRNYSETRDLLYLILFGVWLYFLIDGFTEYTFGDAEISQMIFFLMGAGYGEVKRYNNNFE